MLPCSRISLHSTPLPALLPIQKGRHLQEAHQDATSHVSRSRLRVPQPQKATREAKAWPVLPHRRPGFTFGRDPSPRLPLSQTVTLVRTEWHCGRHRERKCGDSSHLKIHPLSSQDPLKVLVQPHVRAIWGHREFRKGSSRCQNVSPKADGTPGLLITHSLP